MPKDDYRQTETHDGSQHEGQARAQHPYTQPAEQRTARDEASGLRGGPGKEPKWIKDVIESE